MPRALIITDIQNDFCPGGALAINYADRIIPIVNKISSSFDIVVATQDWHPSNHVSFAKTHHKNVHDIITVNGIEQLLWPVHCEAGSYGAAFHKDLDVRPFNLIIHKGMDPDIDSYSTFLENDKKTETGLRFYLKGMHVDEVFLCGLATDYCIHYSALDARNFGFRVYVVTDAVKGIDVPAGSIQAALNVMVSNGAELVTHEQILSGKLSVVLPK